MKASSGWEFWNRAWEINLLKPGVAILRVLITVGAVVGALFVVVMTLKGVNDARGIAQLAVLAGGVGGLIAVVILYGFLMITPDTLWYVMKLETITRDLPEDPAPRGWYPYFLIGSDFARFNAVAIVLGALVGVFLMAFPGLAPAALGKVAGWWRVWVGIMLIAGIGWYSWRFYERARAGDRSSSRYLVGALFCLFLFDGAVQGTRAFAGMAALVLIATGLAAAWGAIGAISRGREPVDVLPFGITAIVCLIPGIAALGSIRFFFTGVKEILTPWMGWFGILSIGGTVSRVAGSAGALLLVMLIVLVGGLIMGLASWLRGDFWRALLNIHVQAVGASGPRSVRAHILVIRVLALIVFVLGVFWAVLLGGAKLLLANFLGAFGGLIHGGTGMALMLVIGWVIPVLAFADLFQGASDAAARYGRDSSEHLLEFRWLKAAMGIMYLGAAALTVAVLVIVLGIAREVSGAASVALIGMVLLIGTVFVALATAIPAFLRDLLKIDGGTRPAGSGRVRVAPGYPGFSFLIILGRIVTWLFLIAGLVLSIFFAVATYHEAHQAPAVMAFLAFVVGILGTLLIAVPIGAGPDFISLILTLKRNFKAMRTGGKEARPESGPDDDFPFLSQLPLALEECGDHATGDPVIPPEGDCLARIRGKRGTYRVERRGVDLSLIDPRGRVCGCFTVHGFVSSLTKANAEETREEEAVDFPIAERFDEVRADAAPTERIQREEAVPPLRPPVFPTPAPETGVPAPGSSEAPPLPDQPDMATLPASPPAAPLRDVERTPEASTEEGQVFVKETVTQPVETLPPRPPLVDVERTPEAMNIPGPPIPVTPARLPDSVPRHGGNEILFLPVSPGDEDALVRGALTELILVKDLVWKYKIRLTSRLDTGGIHLLIVGGEGARSNDRIETWARKHGPSYVSLASRLVAVGLRELARFDASSVSFVRDRSGRVLAPGWVGGEMPPLRGGFIDTGSSRPVRIKTNITKKRIPFVTFTSQTYTVWEVSLT